jgi:hypothetical protein
MVPTSHILLLLLLELDIVIVAVRKTQSFSLHLLLYHIFELVHFLFFVFVEFEACALDVAVTDFAGLALFDLAQIGLTEFDEILGWVDFCHLQSLQKIDRVLFLSRSDKSDGSALIPAPARSPNPMNIIFQVVRADKVDNKHNRPDIQPSRTYTSRDHDIDYTFLEVVDCELSVVGVHRSMKDERGVTIF